MQTNLKINKNRFPPSKKMGVPIFVHAAASQSPLQPAVLYFSLSPFLYLLITHLIKSINLILPSPTK